MQDALARTLEWFKKAVPSPSTKNFTTQVGVHFEEVREMIAEITPRDMATHNLLLDANMALQRLADHLKENSQTIAITNGNRANYLDALCDQIVTAVGCAHMCGLDIIGAVNETNRSNFSKFDSDNKPIFNENMKVMKGPNYTKPDHTPFI